MSPISKTLVRSNHQSKKMEKNVFLSERGCECRSTLTCRYYASKLAVSDATLNLVVKFVVKLIISTNILLERSTH